MFTEEEIESFKKMSSKKIRAFIYIVLAIGFCVKLLSCVTNLMGAHNLAQRIDLSLYDIFNGWISGFNISNTYSGIYCAAYEKLVSASFDLCLVGLLILIIPIYQITIRKNHKIIQLYMSQKNTCNDGIKP